eukprot:s2643_g6.t1
MEPMLALRPRLYASQTSQNEGLMKTRYADAMGDVHIFADGPTPVVAACFASFDFSKNQTCDICIFQTNLCFRDGCSPEDAATSSHGIVTIAKMGSPTGSSLH